MSEKHEVPDDHPRVESLHVREKLIEGFNKNILAKAGLIAHGRGEAFDYILGEKTHSFATKAMEAGIASFLLADSPVFSVNGNVAALTPNEYVQLAQAVGASLEINLFYRRAERVKALKESLLNAGAKTVLGADEQYQTTIPELSHSRRIVDKRGIFQGDVIFVPLEDGDRTKALRNIGKKVITIDLNPLSRTAQWSNITIVDNLVRVLPKMIKISKKLSNVPKEQLKALLEQYNNVQILKDALRTMKDRLEELAEKGRFIEEALGMNGSQSS